MEAILIIIILALAYVVFFLYKKIRKLRRDVHYILDVVENNDYVFRYAIGAKSADRETSQYLNELIEVFERKTDEVRQQEQYFEIIINSLETGILVVNDKDVIVQCNDAAKKLLHRSVLVNLKHANIENQKNLDIQTTTMNLHSQPVTIYSLTDISKKLEMQELESWEKLTRVLTHEIMNSITPIVSISESLIDMRNRRMVQGEMTVTEDYSESLNTIAETGKNLMDFVNNYRSFTNIPMPKLTLFFVKGFLERMIEMARHQQSSSDLPTNDAVAFELKVKPENLILYADESLITRVVSNLLKNAIEAGATKINISASIDEKESVTIDISNNGMLIPDADAEQIFVPFYTTRQNGSGIGLALARRIMQSHGGSITLQNNPQTKFSLFFT